MPYLKAVTALDLKNVFFRFIFLAHFFFLGHRLGDDLVDWN